MVEVFHIEEPMGGGGVKERRQCGLEEPRQWGGGGGVKEPDNWKMYSVYIWGVFILFCSLGRKSYDCDEVGIRY